MALWEAQAVMKSRVPNICSVLLQPRVTSKDNIKSLLSYVTAFVEDRIDCFVDPHIIDIMGNMVSLSFIALKYRVAYTDHKEYGKMLNDHEVASRTLLCLANNAPATNNIHITHLKERNNYSYLENATNCLFSELKRLSREITTTHW